LTKVFGNVSTLSIACSSSHLHDNYIACSPI